MSMHGHPDRAKLLGSEWKCACGAVHSVPVRKVLIGAGVISELSAVVREAAGGGPVLLISDGTTRDIAGANAARMLASSGLKVRELVVPGEGPVVDDKTAASVIDNCGGESLFVSCGSGTVTDLTKYAAFTKGRPFVAVATAPSMNGYASGIVALTEKGLKRTVPAAPPLAVICDLDILCNAPMGMIRAGLGDVISKPCSMADWKLESLVKGGVFCPLPFELIADLESVYLKDSKLIAKREPKIIGALTTALVYSGISMVVAGSSSPASGGEHLISHTLDMRSAMTGKSHDLHGSQVGVATIVTSRLYEKVLSTDPDRLDWAKIWEHHRRDVSPQIIDYWGRLAPSVMREFERKRMPLKEKEAELEGIVERWDEIVDELKVFLRPSADIKRILTEAGAKTHYTDIGAGREDFRAAVLMARTMRSRYTILDLAYDLNLLEDFINDQGDLF